jgi:protein archease
MSRSATPARSKAGWEHFPHDADVGVRGPDATTAEAFEQAAHALTAVITHAEVEPQRSVEVRCEAPDIALSIEVLLRVSKIRFFNICDEGRQG